MENNKVYYIGKDWKDGKVVKYKGTYNALEEAKDKTNSGYAVYDEEGNELYRNNSKKPLIIFLLVLAFLIVGLGATFSIYNYMNRTIPSQEDEYNYYTLPDGTEIRYSKNELLVKYPNGTVVVPEGGGKVVFPDGTEREVPGGTVVLPPGVIIIPDKIPPTVDEFGNVRTEDDKTTVVSRCGEREVPKGTIIRPNGTMIIPDKNSRVYVDKHNYVHVVGSATVVLPNCEEIKVSDGTVITPGTIKDSGGDDQTIVDPNGGSKPTVDDNGNIITNDDNGKVINQCGTKTVNKGTIVRPDGTIIIPDVGSSLRIDSWNNVIVNGTATVIMPDCTEYKVSNGTVITPGDNDGETGTKDNPDHKPGTIIDPGDGKNPPVIDDKGNIITDDDDTKVITPNCGTKNVNKGTIVRPDGTIVIPEKGTVLTIDANNNIIVTKGKAKVIMPDCTEYTVSAGTVITPGDNGTDGKGKDGPTDNSGGNGDGKTPGTIIDPGDGKKPPIVDDKGNVTTDDNDGKVITPNCGIKTVPKGTLVRPDGTIYIPSTGSKVYVNNNNEVVVEGTATMIKTDCSESTITGKTIPKEEEKPVCDSSKKCCVGDTYLTNKNCKNPNPTPVDPEKPEEPDPVPTNLSILFEEGNELVAYDIKPGDTIGTKTFTVKNTGDGNVTYNILWTKVINQYVSYADLVVTIKRNGKVVTTDKVLPTKNSQMLGNVLIKVGETHDYELELRYIDTGKNQNVDQSKTFSTVINIEGYQYVK